MIAHAHDPDGTYTDNGVLLCWHHHRTLDTSGWQIRMHHGTPQIKAPSWLDRSGQWRPAQGSPSRITAGVTAPTALPPEPHRPAGTGRSGRSVSPVGAAG